MAEELVPAEKEPRRIPGRISLPVPQPPRIVGIQQGTLPPVLFHIAGKILFPLCSLSRRMGKQDLPRPS